MDRYYKSISYHRRLMSALLFHKVDSKIVETTPFENFRVLVGNKLSIDNIW